MGRTRLYFTDEDRKRANVIKQRRHRLRYQKALGFGAHVQRQDPPPDYVLADAQFRNAIPDPLFGDPKPGQSALDKRRQ